MNLEVRQLRPGDDRSGFRSGSIDLDRFFQRFAGQNQFRRHLGTTWIAIEAGEICGFVTLCAAQIEIARIPVRQRKGLPSYPLPTLRIARLAVDNRCQRRGVGAELMKTAVLVARELALKVGCVGLIVDAKPGAVRFYSGYGFEPVDVVQGALGDRPVPQSMFLPLPEIPS